jgi:hypothetical protein
MEQNLKSEQSWGVICLHCRKPFSVPYEPAASADPCNSQPQQESRTLFLAWCPACNREAPYAIGELMSIPGPSAIRRTSGRVYAFERVAGAS